MQISAKEVHVLIVSFLPFVARKPSPVHETVSPVAAVVEETAPPLEIEPKPRVKPEPPKPKERLREPEFILKLRDRSVVEGSSIRLACRAMGTPVPSFQWFKNDQPINSDGRYDITQSVSGFTLVVKDCQLEDSANYKCTATNKAGSVSTAAKVTVTGK